MRTISATKQGLQKKYSATVVAPHLMAFLYNKHLYIKVASAVTDADGINITASTKVQCIVDAGDRGVIDSLFRYPNANGNMTFDIAPAMRALLEKNVDNELDMLTHHARWESVLVNARIYIDGYNILSVPFNVVNGRNGIAESWRIEPQRLKWWDGYPFTFDFPNVDRMTVEGFKSIALDKVDVDYNLMQSLVRLDPANNFEFELPYMRRYVISTNSPDEGFVIHDNELYKGINTVIIDRVKCSSDGRIYLRWLGRHGEVFYWLFFGKSDDMTVKSDVFNRYEPTSDFLDYHSDSSNRILRTSSRRSVGITRNMAIYSELVSSHYHDMLSSLLYSPVVDMYIGENTWKRVTVADGNISKDVAAHANQKKYRFAFTINTDSDE